MIRAQARQHGRYDSRSLAILALAVVGLPLVALAGTTRVASAQDGDQAALYPIGYQSGVPEVDALMAVLNNGDGDALAARLELMTLPCTHEIGGSVTNPPCEPGESEGTEVQVMLSSGCELGYVREPRASERLAAIGQSVYRLAFAYDNGSQIAVKIGTGAADGYRTIFIAKGSGGVNGISGDCGGQLSVPSDADFLVSPLVQRCGATTDLTLSGRWTLVAWPGTDDISVMYALSGDDCGNDVTSRVAVIWGFDATTQTYQAYFPDANDVPGANDLDTFTSGLGYWVALNDPSSAVTWTVLAGEV